MITQKDVLRKYQDGYYLIQPIDYDDKEPPYYLAKDEMGRAYAERKDTGTYRPNYHLEKVPRPIVHVMLKSGKVKLEKRTSNWKKFCLGDT